MHVVDVIDHLFSSFTIATLSIGAFTVTQQVRFHLYNPSITMPYVKEGGAVQKTRH